MTRLARVSSVAALFAFAAFVALEATLFGAVAGAGESGHTGGSHGGGEHGQPGFSVVLAALLVSSAGIAFVPFAGLIAAAKETAADERERQLAIVRTAVALLSTGAALIHFAVLWEHLEEYWPKGAFFAILASLQLAWAGLVLSRPSRPLILAGVVGNTAVVAVWLLSRTVGLPLGPDAGVPEPVGLADALATLFELLLVAGGAILVRGRVGRLPLPPLARRACWALGFALIPLTALSLLAAVQSH